MERAAALKITPALAQGIVDATMADLAYNVNVMDENGVIIASGDHERIGSRHPGAVRALATGQPIEITRADASQRIGINLPITLQGERVGAVGITGPLIEVRPLADLVRTSVILMLAQRKAIEFQESIRSRVDSIVDSMAMGGARGEGQVADPRLAHVENMSSPKVVVLVDAEPAQVEGLRREAFEASPGHFLVDPQRVDAVLAGWSARLPGALFYVSEAKDLARDAVTQVDELRSLCQLVGVATQIRRAENLGHLTALSRVSAPAEIRRLATVPELVETLRAFVATNQSVNETSAALHLHRNTLLYRLNRIRTLTGYDPRDVLDLVALISFLLQRDQPERDPRA